MALAFEVKNKEITGGAYASQAPRSTRNSQTITWQALAIDDESPPIPGGIKPEKISELDVLNWKPGGFRNWPEPNVDLFTQTGLDDVFYVQPWLICDLLNAMRDRQRRELWMVSAQFSTGNRQKLTQDDLELIPAPAPGAGLVDAYPFLIETIWGQEDRILERENNFRPPDPDPGSFTALELPTGSLYSEPFYGRFPKKTIRQTQFESFADDDAVKAAIDYRLFTTNGSIYQNDPAGFFDPNTGSADPPRWMITDIDYQRVRLPDSTFNYTDAYLMTYLIERSSLPGGWWERRLLVDDYFLRNVSGELKRTPARDDVDKQTIITIKLNKDGTKRNPQEGDAETQDYVVQPLLNWSGFLK